MPAEEAERPPPRQVDPTSLRGLAHPLRVQMLDALVTYGPATATMLARRFGESTASTSYHLRQLAKHGFVEEDTVLGMGRERYWRAYPGGARLDSYDMFHSPATSEAARLVVDEFQRAQAARLAYWLSVGHRSETREWAMATINSTSHLRLRADELGELSKQLMALVDSWRARVQGRADAGAGADAQAEARTVEVQISTFPVPDQDEP